MLAIMSQASALAMVASKSLARRRLRPSQAKVRSTTQRRGRTLKPVTSSLRLTISSVHWPIFSTPGQDLEARHVVASLDDLQRPLADLFQRLAEFRSGVVAIGEDVAQPGEGPSDRGEQRRRTVAVLDMGGVNHASDEPPAGVGEDMALAPLNQLAGVEPARAAAFRGFHRLAVDHTGGRAGLSALGLARA